MPHSTNRQSDPILIDLPSEITTERLLLRVPRAGDGPRVNAAVVESAAELAPWMPWANPTPKVEDTEVWCRQAAAKFLGREQIPFSIYPKDDPTYCIGNAGLHHVYWKIPTAEVGYWIRTSETGKGYATEAVGALVKFAFETMKVNRLQLRCDLKNRRSAGVAERCGFLLEGVMRSDSLDHDGKLRDTCLYSRIRVRSPAE
jgi:RimJ/RimL family protein N-acetyltransferase